MLDTTSIARINHTSRRVSAALWKIVVMPSILFVLWCSGVALVFLILWNRGQHPASLSGYPTSSRIEHQLKAHGSLSARLCVPPLRTEGRDIVDHTGVRCKLSSVNWYGASDIFMVPGGLDTRHRRQIAKTIRQLGFNSVRLPYADEMVKNNPAIEAKYLDANKDLVGKPALEVFAAVVDALTDVGLAVIINNHITQARWCCDGMPCDASWTNQGIPFCPVYQTEEGWIENLVTVMRPHIWNPLVVGVDLRNEVRGLLGSQLWNSWAAAVERAAHMLHHLQPDWLMVVEGVSSANDISGAGKRPVKLEHDGKLVYSAHVYGWSGWGSLDPYWYRKYDSFAEDMDRNWEYLRKNSTAPVWVGEIGSPRDPAERDLHYWKNLMRYLQATDVDVAYWALNPRKPKDNEVETYGLLEDDWVTPIYDYRLWDLAKLRKGH